MIKKQSNYHIYINELDNEISNLKTNLNDPYLYVYNYFYELKRTIDIDFTSKEIELIEEGNDNNLIEINNLNTDWNLLVDKIELFETECKKSKHLHINYLTLMEEKLSMIDLNLNNLKSYNDTFANKKTIQFNRLVKSLYEETKEMIQQIKHEFGKYLFINKTIVYLSKADYLKEINNNIDDNDDYFKPLKCFQKLNIGKLILITNEYINEENINTNLFTSISSTNHMKSIKNESLKLDILKNVELDSNQIEEIHLDLSKIDLSEMNLKTFPNANIYKDFQPYLTHLLAAHNYLKEFNKSIVNDCIQLRLINFSFNQIEYIQSNSFQGLVNLEEINLKRNRLKSIDKWLFRGLFKLKRVYLNGNLFSDNKLQLHLEKSVEFISFKRNDCIHDIIYGALFFRFEVKNDLNEIIQPIDKEENKRKRIKLN